MTKRNRVRRSPREWAWRSGWALMTAALGYVAVTASLAAVEVPRSPETAYALAPHNAQAAAALAQQLFKQHPDGDPAGRAAQLAQQAVREDATAVPAVVVLASQALLRGEAQRGRRLFDYAQGLSRRDVQTQLWFIEAAVTRGDVPSAIRHYDIALRTTLSASSILYPVLAAALAEPAVRSSLIATLATNPMWEPTFIAFAIGSDTDPRHVASLLSGMRAAKITVSPEASASLINRLLLIGADEDAWRYYASLRPGLQRNKSRDPRFADKPVSTSRFDWVATGDSDVTATIQRSDAGGLVDLSVPAGHGGTLLAQVQMLRPGAYRLSAEGSGIDQPEASLPYWTLTCRDGHELGRIAMARSEQHMAVTTGILSVPAGCPMQTLALVARPSDGVEGLTGQVGRAELAPAP